MTSRGSGEKSGDQSSLPAPVEKIPRLACEISRSSYPSSCCRLGVELSPAVRLSSSGSPPLHSGASPSCLCVRGLRGSRDRTPTLFKRHVAEFVRLRSPSARTACSLPLKKP
ncbi:hypothetical protein AOLI_G00046950 [Acnodon oligacanthus]